MRMPGEDVVAGIRTPEDIDTVKYVPLHTYKELRENCDILEAHYKEMMVLPLCLTPVQCMMCLLDITPQLTVIPRFIIHHIWTPHLIAGHPL
uniref:Uncharacterized protein n=2 Tax=Physcomitrium patens TaxID=3218 RepID=A0A7I3ZIA7_PHYPA